MLVKDVQLDPVTNHLLHADFYRVNMDRKITVTVPVVLKGEPRGVKVEGGVLDFVHREIEVETLPAEIPDAIEVDVSDLGLGDSVHVRDVAANAAWTPISDPDMMLVHVVSRKVGRGSRRPARRRQARRRRRRPERPSPKSSRRARPTRKARKADKKAQGPTRRRTDKKEK